MQRHSAQIPLVNGGVGAPFGTDFASTPINRGKSRPAKEHFEAAAELKVAMNRQTLNEYRKLLVELRERVGGEVNRVVEAIQEGVNIDENISSAPVHIADVAGEAVDAKVTVLQTERGILDEINAALERIADGTYGQCGACGAEIPAARLHAIPYTAHCVKCAREEASGRV